MFFSLITVNAAGRLAHFFDETQQSEPPAVAQSVM